MAKTVTIQEWLDQGRNGYTDQQIEEAWAAVKPVGNWKMPIEQTMPAHLVARFPKKLVETAINWVAGGGAEFVHHEDGSYTVFAPGYYERIGA